MRITPVTPPVNLKSRRPSLNSGLLEQLADRVIGQPQALESIVPYVQMHQARLAPEGRPAGVFLLLGPTGTGKTRTVEVLAEALHGNEKHLLKVDCGEFQMEHEVAKLIGAPPGYLGHRETPPMFTQQKLAAVTSDTSDLALILFDEIEKAAPSMTRLLLGVLDKATLRLGDNTTVNFERTLIFLTSNLGAREMQKELLPDFGFEAVAAGAGMSKSVEAGRRKLTAIASSAVRRRFPPEFVNRIDSVITYLPLESASLATIVDQQIAALEKHIENRLEDDAFEIEVTAAARRFLLELGTSQEFGARELKRTILRQLTQPMAAMVANGTIQAGDLIEIDTDPSEGRIVIEVKKN